MTEAQDLGSKESLAATLREREQAGVHATAYYYPPGWGEAMDCAAAVGPIDCNTARQDADTALASTQTEFPTSKATTTLVVAAGDAGPLRSLPPHARGRSAGQRLRTLAVRSRARGCRRGGRGVRGRFGPA